MKFLGLELVGEGQPRAYYRKRHFIPALSVFVILFGVFALSFAQEAIPETTPSPDPLAAYFPPTPTPMPPPAPYHTVSDAGVTLELFFPNLAQGMAGLVHVDGEGIIGANATFINRAVTFFAAPPLTGYYGLLAVGITQTVGLEYPLTVEVAFADGRTATLTAPISVVVGHFITQEVTVQPDRAYLASNEVEGVEQSRLQEIFAGGETGKLWDTVGIEYPIQGELTSPFGAVRTFNTGLAARHTGWDFNAMIGTPLAASGAGRVAFAGTLDVRGNYVLIDHGGGMFTGYAHLSQIHVTRGQRIATGQIIGMSGNTGRSSAAHFHWEAVVHGEWVDPVLLAEMWLP